MQVRFETNNFGFSNEMGFGKKNGEKLLLSENTVLICRSEVNLINKASKFAIKSSKQVDTGLNSPISMLVVQKIDPSYTNLTPIGINLRTSPTPFLINK